MSYANNSKTESRIANLLSGQSSSKVVSALAVGYNGGKIVVVQNWLVFVKQSFQLNFN